MSETLILGAGISGLAAGWSLRRQGIAARLLEAAETPGGKIRTVEQNGFRFELGPHAVQGSPEFFDLVEAAGLKERLVPASDQLKKRFIVSGGRLVVAPSGPKEAWSTPLISKKGILRALSEPIRRRGPGPHESVTRFVERRLGKEIARLMDALVLGIFAGDPDELAMAYAFPRIYRLEAEYGGLFRGAMALRKARPKTEEDKKPYLCSFPGGLGEWVERLASELEISYRHKVEAVRAADGGFVVEGRSADGDFELKAQRLICALPIHVAARLLKSLGSTGALTRLPHAPVAVLSLGFERGQIAHPLDGFGFLSPHYEDRMLLGCLFSSSLFPRRAPEGHVALTVMAGGRRRPEELELSDEVLLDRVLYELENLLGAQGPPVVSRITRWVPGIAQATARTAQVKEAVREIEKEHEGLVILGDWLHGVGVPACVKAGWNIDA